MNIEKEIRKPSNIVSAVCFLVVVLWYWLGTNPVVKATFELLMFASFGYVIVQIVTPWIMEGIGLKDPVDQ